VINTGAGPITVSQKGTIKVKIMRSDGSTNCLTFSNVLYAPQMFVSVLSHSVLRQKNLWYHGYKHKLLYREQDGIDAEVAYTPEINWIPTLLMADDELMEAQSLAFAAVTQPVTSKLCNSQLTPSRKVTLHKLHHMFGHADVATLCHMVDTTTGLRLKDVTAFSCETCLIGNSHKQYSRRKPTSPATRFLQRVYVDIVDPITPTAEDGVKYEIIYTDSYTRYQWINVTDSKSSLTGRFLSFVNSAGAFYGCKIAIIHVDNDTVIVNHKTRKVLCQRSTIFKLSTPYSQYQNDVAESSNRLTEYRCRNTTIAAPHIPESMWPYASRYAIELLNHTLSQVLNSKTPQQLQLESMGVANPIPNLHSFCSYGETGYVHREQRQKGAKFDGHAVPMHFVGRESSRIYLM
jgi:transposase InsO family protein